MLLPRRFQSVFAILFLVFIAFILLSNPSSRKLGSQGLKIPKLPTSLPLPQNPFRPLSHKPPEEQANSTAGETHWYSDWEWRNPFSSVVTLDDNRAVLPPQQPRPHIYTFYDTADKRDEKTQKAEHELLLTWRRAWWAQGFKPIILGRSEAKNNPLYRELKRLKPNQDLENEIMRLLAWGSMGTGMLADWLAYPMAPYYDPILSFLRRGEFPELLAFEGLKSSLLCGEKNAINEAVRHALEHSNVKMAKTVLDILPVSKLESKPDSIAVYDVATVSQSYTHIATALQKSGPYFSLSLLPELINSHLHNTWLYTFPKGINVVKPLGKDPTTTLHNPLIDLARNLTQCPSTPIPSSCPPNNPKCQTCVTNRPLSINILPTYRNHTDTFTLGILPHPYTLSSLLHKTPILTTRLLRRSTPRNPWLSATTLDLLGHGTSSTVRVLRFKDLVASDFGASHSLWMTPEPYSFSSSSDAKHEIGSDEWLRDLDWIFGFKIPRELKRDGRSETPVPGPKQSGQVPERELLQREREVLDAAVRVVVGGEKAPLEGPPRKGSVVQGVLGWEEQRRVMRSAEAWSLADVEAWRFVRAWNARRRVERGVWEEEERRFAGSEGRERGWGAWLGLG
ncbi:MAG: hypothetical protein M1820_004455 [Bogoriella megaspora]|nr:MAG: hypothetical protein M1820_004455 [Bogoriella megaspora]